MKSGDRVQQASAPQGATVETIPGVLRRTAATWPDSIALISDEEQVSYREYAERAHTLTEH